MCFDPPERRIADSSPVTVVDLILEQATAQPDHPAIVTAGEPDSVITYAELAARVRSRTDALQRAGLQHAERCGLVAQQGPGFIEAALAIMATGACVVPIPDDLSGIPLETFANRAYLHKLVLEREDFACRAFAPGAASASGDRPPPEEEFRALEPAYLRFTSGTTSVRKGVVLSHETILRRLDGAQRGLSILPEDKILWLLPMAHHFVVSILLYLRHGATVLLPKSSLARDVLDLANRHGATFLYASPYHYGLLAKDASPARLDTTRLAISTAEGLRADTADRFRARFGFPLVQALGIIEVGLSVLNRRAAARKPGALGEALPDYRIVVPRRQRCGSGARGRSGANWRDLHPRPRALRCLPGALDPRKKHRRTPRLSHRGPGLDRPRWRSASCGKAGQPHQHGGHEVLRRRGRSHPRHPPRRPRQSRLRSGAPGPRRDSRRRDRRHGSGQCARSPGAFTLLPRASSRLQDPQTIPGRREAARDRDRKNPAQRCLSRKLSDSSSRRDR